MNLQEVVFYIIAVVPWALFMETNETKAIATVVQLLGLFGLISVLEREKRGK